MRGKKAGHFREVAGMSIVDVGGPCVLGRHFNGRQPSDLIRLLDKSSLGGRMRGIKIPQQDFALKMQGGGHICGTLRYLKVSYTTNQAKTSQIIAFLAQ